MSNVDNKEWECGQCRWQNTITRRCHKNPPMPIYNPSSIDNNILYEYPKVSDDNIGCSYFEERIKAGDKAKIKVNKE